ncbi:hypothetical protein O6H91_12G054800 [Diphasiastrum complanatum]|uniref:Uncharacterized protein n=3 Tax=Diphasiastrum complanatum TaxID=34168 RepID=A0ACC2C206_DIPCM|nr:hypothetical protein O6H91_12G054800 [Diphasiastrum complanatum]KAJ7536041.1 hypothetical protein O6H91_12G054800 [Diphasiastrum complanatum]KAJ7536042.1 hypothetical protein O6H91_12G054800 [Diphasiastrum complanatum]
MDDSIDASQRPRRTSRKRLAENDNKSDVTVFKQIKVDDVKKMVVTELRSALCDRGLPASGTKKDLAERLTTALLNNIVSMDAVDKEDSAKDAELEEKIVTATKKGNAVLDQYLPSDIQSKFHVLQRGDVIYDAMLNQTNVGDNNNKFYVLQVLESDTSNSYHVYNRWGRVGVKGQDKLAGPYSSRDQAIIAFETKFFEKTKNDWSERHSFVPFPKKYTWLEMDYDEAHEKEKESKEQLKEKQSAINKTPKESKLDKRVATFISLICNLNMMKRQMMEIGYDARKMPLGKLSKSTILKGYEALKKIAATLDSGNHKTLSDLSSDFYTVIPHDFGFQKMGAFVIDTQQKLKRKLEMVEALGEIELATKILEDADDDDDDDPTYNHYKHLKCEMQPLDDNNEEAAWILNYVNNTHGKTHSSYKLEVLQIFKVNRDAEVDHFKPFSNTPNRMMLWHGSRLTNWTGILSQGLRIAPPEAPVNGYMFGKGVYFADMVSKSANYCYISHAEPVGVLLLCEVALGEIQELKGAKYDADKLPSGKLSTKGLGSTAPDPKGFMVLQDGVIVPVSKPKKVADPALYLLYNEYIVYNTAQIRMRYLLQVKFNYN